MPAGGATCMLLVGDRVVLRASSPPEAEFAMFELAEIELRTSEPGRVREHGYQTTVEQALARLTQHGATLALARACGLRMAPLLAEAYARGAAVRHVARYLGPLELFQSDAYDGGSHLYQGTFLDLPQLSSDLGLAGASAALQALYLAALLAEEKPDVTVFLQTEAWTKQRKPGERTFKRAHLTALKDLESAISDLSTRKPAPQISGQLPRADVMAFVRARADAAPDQDTRDLYVSLERGISSREMPEKGPLAEPELWAIEARLDSGALDGILTALEQVEGARGRTPGTTYLRARASLALHLEPPKLVAERVSALALSLTSFQELALLAAEAWLEAGEPRRAMPYARDLVDAPVIDEGLRLKAQRVLARAVGAAPHRRAKTIADSMPAGPLPPSQPPPSLRPVSVPAPGARQSVSPEPSRGPASKGNIPRPPTSPGLGVPQAPQSTRTPAASAAPPAPAAPSAPPAPPAPAGLVPPTLPPPDRKPSLPPVSTPKRSEKPARASVPSGNAPPPLDLDLTPPPVSVSASFTLDMPGPAPIPEELMERKTRSSPRILEQSMRRSLVPDPREEPPESDSKITTRQRTPSEPTRPAMTAPVVEAASKLTDDDMTPPRGQRRPGAAAPPPAPQDPKTIERQFMLGASQPPYRTEDPAPLLPRAPLLPKSGPADELAEHLSLPTGVSTDVELTALPQSVLEARVMFTLLARELGLDYRLKRGTELRADVSGIEAMQAVLLETFPDHVVKTPEDAHEVRRHGALLAEILARSLDAEWVDISPKEIGRWSMIVPPDTRVWPFGRVARLIQMGHKERDLVSYFLELKSRARTR